MADDLRISPQSMETDESLVATGPDGVPRWSNQNGRAVLIWPDHSQRSIREIVSPILTANDDFAGSVTVFQDATDARAFHPDLVYAPHAIF